MSVAAPFLRASWDAARRFFAPAWQAFEAPRARVPIRSLGPSHAPSIRSHLLALSEEDRYLRFGAAASDEQIGRYVAGLDFDRDEVFGIYNRRLHLLAVAHLAFSVDPQCQSQAEFGVSVLPRARGRGFGARLFDRAIMHARNEGVSVLHVHALSENTAMLKIARQAGARVEREGSETACHLRLPPADIDSHISELMEEQLAQTDYRLKVQARQFGDLLALVHEVRQGVRAARKRMPM